MERKRSTLEIDLDILKMAINGARATAIIYGANLNFSILKAHVKTLKDAGLLRVEEISIKNQKTSLFTTTDKGRILISSMTNALSLYQEPQFVIRFGGFKPSLYKSHVPSKEDI